MVESDRRGVDLGGGAVGSGAGGKGARSPRRRIEENLFRHT
jgi:hypothetical protein